MSINIENMEKPKCAKIFSELNNDDIINLKDILKNIIPLIPRMNSMTKSSNTKYYFLQFYGKMSHYIIQVLANKVKPCFHQEYFQEY